MQDAAAPTAQRSTPAEASPFRPAPSSPVAARRSATTRSGARSGDIDAAAAIRLDDVLARLDPSSVRDAPLALEGLARSLAPDERVDHVVQGWAKGNPCVVARTDRRVVVVLDRFPEPVVESLHPVRTSLTVYGPPGTERVSLAVLDRRRLLEVTGIRDANEARTMSSGGTAAGRSADRRGGEPEYF